MACFRGSAWAQTAPQITQQPSGQTVTEGENVEFSVVATGSNLVYLWAKDGEPLLDGGRVSGAATATLTISGTLESDEGFYSVAVSVSGFPELKTSSDSAQLKVDPPTPPAPVITQQPAGQTVTEGQDAIFTVVATGSNLLYQWARDGEVLLNGGRLSGVTTTTLTITEAQEVDEGSYSVVVSVQGYPEVKTSSNGALLKVDPPTPPAPQITQQPVAQTVTEGQNVQFSVVATGANLVYQWARDGEVLLNGGRLSGTATATLTINGVLEADEGSYSVVVLVQGYPEVKTGSDGALLLVNPLTYYQAWSAANGVTGSDSGPDEDFDHDGIKNLLELGFGTNPTAASAGVITLNGAAITQRGSHTMWLQNIANGVDRRALFGRRKDYLAAGLTYTVQFSGDLVGWTDSVAIPAVVAGDTEFDAVTVPYPLFVNGRKARFFRVTVSLP
jgi:uncharacterized protein GlcG (DUF336 family)